LKLSYDSIADRYHKLAVPLVFKRPAKDLLSALKLSPDSEILDVGAGAGATALAIQEIDGFEGHLFELDVSQEMLRASVANDRISKVCGQLPGLPFCDESFDAVMSNFVLSHVKDYRDALADMVRVLKPEGKAGITAWGDNDNKYTNLWQETAESFVGSDLLNDAATEYMPSREIFANPERVCKLLEDSGLCDIKVMMSEQAVTTSIDDFLEIRNILLRGRFLKETLDSQGWSKFQEELLKRFHSNFSDPIEYDSSAHIVVGIKQ
jgi:ubiquinone/menaquinone biosynthesis C-methylase UbiE